MPSTSHPTPERHGGSAPQLVRAIRAALLLAVGPASSLSAQHDVAQLAVRLAGMTAVTGLEQAMTDSLVALVPGATRDRAGNVTLTLGTGAPRRLVACPLDEVGFVVGDITPAGYLLLRRVGSRGVPPLFDQALEGHRVSVFGARGLVPGVVAVRSTHLARGRAPAGGPDPVFTVDNAYVDIGAASAAEAQALGIRVLAPVSLTKQPARYGDRLLAAPVAGRRAACAALLAAVAARPRVRGTVVAAFTVASLATENPGFESVVRLLGPFQEIVTLGSRPGVPGSEPVAASAAAPGAERWRLATRYSDTPVEAVSLRDAERVATEVTRWMEAK